MSSSDETGLVRNTAEPQSPASGYGADEDGLEDPWFTPDPKPDPDDTNWFLPTGREGLRPDVVTWDDSGSGRDPGRAEAVGAPPWDGDRTPSRAGQPPPWEIGPWPGPGETALRGAGSSEVAPGNSGSSEAAPRRSRVANGSPAAQPVAKDPQPSAGTPSRRMLLAVGGAVVLIVVAVVVIATSLSGGTAAGCATYPAAVRQAYAKAMSDLNGNAPASVLAPDLERAASLANSSAAAASQSTARTALFAMASDLDEAHSEASIGTVAPALVTRLTADGTALPRSCSS